MIKKILGFIGIFILGLIIGGLIMSSSSVLGGGQPNRFPNGYIDTGYGYYVNGTAIVNSSGVVIGTVSSTAITANSLTIGSSGTAITGRKCAPATWNPGSLGTSTLLAAVTSTDITLTGAVMGDLCEGSLSSATTSLASISCFITGTASATIRLMNLDSSALDIATGTAKVCYTH